MILTMLGELDAYRTFLASDAGHDLAKIAERVAA